MIFNSVFSFFCVNSESCFASLAQEGRYTIVKVSHGILLCWLFHFLGSRLAGLLWWHFKPTVAKMRTQVLKDMSGNETRSQEKVRSLHAIFASLWEPASHRSQPTDWFWCRVCVGGRCLRVAPKAPP